jgi:hypothetical protein
MRSTELKGTHAVALAAAATIETAELDPSDLAVERAHRVTRTAWGRIRHAWQHRPYAHWRTDGEA